MPRENVNDLRAFVAVAKERSFTRAAAGLGLTQSALSHTIRQLEERLGVRLLTRTTRAVAPTEAGQRLLNGVTPHLEAIDAEIEALGMLRDMPAGTVRIVSSEYGISHVLWPKLAPFLKTHSDIKVEITQDNGLNEIVTEGYDAGVRRGEHLAKDMISARIGPDLRYIVVGSPALLDVYPTPSHPRELDQIPCVNFLLQSSGIHFAWQFKEEERELRVRVDGQLAFNNVFDCLKAAEAGFGLSYVPDEIAQKGIASGKLIQVLETFCPTWDGFHLYYPNRRQASPAFQAVLNALRYRG
ncbi:DNA-binding transcriptional regulator, LysR family [Cohaesibacter marisflavi]|uniref:DNA-binding transcriptional regulator, LysR family n=1 Tax=Cohaesibacter marisflavi TaxID=655353 RepID=A0A1I5N1Q3_9HYPH|nr:LysR family transcriptional regulator [Cohaesibacter marisflavi]SFP15627.1 DNA-binding transcriptional regulator, LysR family [Cohaesibacter marisflavi]